MKRCIKYLRFFQFVSDVRNPIFRAMTRLTTIKTITIRNNVVLSVDIDDSGVYYCRGLGLRKDLYYHTFHRIENKNTEQ